MPTLSAEAEEVASPAEQQEYLREVLTEREFEVFELVAAGLSNTEIAKELFVAEATIKTLLNRLLTKGAISASRGNKSETLLKKKKKKKKNY